MKKKHIIIASIVGASALIAGSAAVTIVLNDNSNNKTVIENHDILNESTLSEDNIFSNGLSSIVVNKDVKKSYNSSTSDKLLKPVIGRQYSYNEAEGRISIRFYAAITSLDVDAVWTRTLYNSDGSVNTALSTGTMTSSKAYSSLGYVENNELKYLTPQEAVAGVVDASDVDKYQYFVIYTLKDIKISKYGDCTIDANVEISNSTQTIVSKTGSVTTNSTPTVHTYEMDLSLENQYQGTNTSAGNGQFIYGKAKTIYASTDLSADPSNIYPIVYKDGVLQENSGTSNMTLSFKDDTTNAADDYLVYSGEKNEKITSKTIGMFTITGSDGNVADNNDWLKFNSGGKISFTVTKATKLSMTFYDGNNVKVYVDDVEIGQSASGDYFLPKGDVEIVSVGSGYIGKVILEMGVVSVTGLKSGVTGKQTLTATYGNVSQTFDVYVLSTSCAYKDADGNYVVTVDKSWTGDIGAVSSDRGNMFTTISQALEFLQNTSFVAKNGTKILNISAGYYREKLEITTPNLTIQGAGICKGTYSDDENYKASEYNAATIIEFDSLYGEQDVNGFTQVTDSTQTVAVRESATNCKISGVTISNAWNCKAYFDDTEHTSSDHRALALLVQADKFILEDSALLGYQDTLELFTGRQYFKDSYISGTTDFIFGTNNTTLFEGCEIHSIYNGSSDGGYINAFKGCNSGSNDYINYGVIYYNCDFTADEAITSSNTSIARAWAGYQMVSIINSRIGGHISKAAYSGETKNERYVAWNKNTNEPTDEYVRYSENGNTGTGAISASQTGVTYLDSTTAASYHDIETIFGTTNGKVVYNTAWDPSSDVVEKDYNVYYWFHGTAPDTGTVYQIDSQYENTSATYTVGDITFNNCYRRTERNGDVRVDGSVEITVKAGTTVTIQTYPGYHSYKIGDVYANQDTIVYYFDTAQTITLEKAGSSFYLYSIIINERQEAQATPVMTGLSVTGYPLSELELNEEYDLSGLSVKALYSNGTYKVATGYDIDDEEVVHSDTAGTYTVTVTYNDGTTTQTQTFDITYAASVETRITETTSFTFCGTAYSGTNLKNLNDADHKNNLKTGTMEKVTFNTDGSNSENNWLKFNNGNTILFETADVCLLNICFYQGTNNAVVTLNGKTISALDVSGTANNYTKYGYELKEAGTVVITSTGSGYIGFFETIFGVEFPEEQEETVIENNLTISFATDGNGYGTIEGVQINCTPTDHNDGSAYIKGGSIVLSLKDAATVTITANWGLDIIIGDTAYKNANAGGTYDGTVVEYNASAGDLVITMGDSGKNYIKTIKIEY